MNPARYQPEDYIQFLIAASGAVSCVEAAAAQPAAASIAHDAVLRMLTRVPPDPATVWADAEGLVERDSGVLVVDDSTIDKPHGRHIDLVGRHWSGVQRKVVWGINLTTLVWSNVARVVPVDVRVYAKPTDGLTKNEHLRHMLTTANERGFQPAYVLFDSWYSGLENLKHVRSLGWQWMCRIKCNRQVNPDGTGLVAVKTLDIPTEGLVVHLKGYGLVRVFRTAAPDSHAEYWASSDLALSAERRTELEAQAWGIEVYHRALKQCCNITRCQVRSAAGHFQHLLCAVRAFLRLEAERVSTGQTWYAVKQGITRVGVRLYLAQPHCPVPIPPTA